MLAKKKAKRQSEPATTSQLDDDASPPDSKKDRHESDPGKSSVAKNVSDAATQAQDNSTEDDDPTTPVKDTVDVEELKPLPEDERGSFEVLEHLPDNPVHHFAYMTTNRLNQSFGKTLRKEYKLLQSSVPKGVHIRTFEQRTDLFTAMIVGPAGTPYEDGLFLFDIALPQDYPTAPPKVQYIAYTKERLNPNLYVEGKVCLSLLGTWNGSGTETWNSSKSSLLQLFVSIQALVLNSTPYYNEPSSEARRDVTGTHERARLYNESAFVLTIEHTLNVLQMAESSPFYDLLRQHVRERLPNMVERVKRYTAEQPPADDPPHFDLLPLTKGAKLTAHKWIDRLEEKLKKINL